MASYWWFIALAALGYLWLQHFRRQRAAATPGGAAEAWDQPAELRGGRMNDIRARAAAQQTDSWLLQPETPAGAQQRTETGGGQGGAVGEAARIAESVTAVLRKQIPPRDEPPRSWLGGLPMLPPGVEWPRGVNPEDRDKGEVPLHFIAQVACADLPADLWGGLGPREGWLLLFVNGNTCDAEDKGAWRVLHVEELGEERQPPADIGPIHDGMYCGSTSWTLRESVYPRWPVDIVAMPNELRIEGQRSYAAPEDLLEQLYPGCRLAADNPSRLDVPPFTWRCLDLAIEAALASVEAPNPNSERYRVSMREKLEAPGGIERIVPDLQREEEEFQVRYGAVVGAPEDTLTEDERTRRANMLRRAEERQRQIDEVAALIALHPTPESLLARLEQEGEKDWYRQIADFLRELRTFVRERDLDESLSASNWNAIAAEIAATDRQIWALGWGRGDNGLPVTVERRTLSLTKLFERPLADAIMTEARECYLDPARRSLVPLEAQAWLEASWRKLYENRPHRMGGYHDGLQSDAEPGLTDRLLLLQFAVDDAVDWVWGDNGAVYCFISPENLQSRAWDKAEFWLECH